MLEGPRKENAKFRVLQRLDGLPSQDGRFVLQIFKFFSRQSSCCFGVRPTLGVPDPGKGGWADPVNRGAILEGEGLGPPSGDKERQLSPDRERGKT